MAALAVGLVVTLGLCLPSPGLDLGTHAQLLLDLEGFGPSPALFELGLRPLLTVLILLELAKLAVPRTVGRAFRIDGPGDGPFVSLVGLLALAVAGLQATTIYGAYDEIGLLDESRFAKLAGIASLVAGAAVLIWLADRIRLAGLERSGLWVVYALLVVGAVPYDLYGAVEGVRLGIFAPSTIALVLLAIVPAALTIVFTTTALRDALLRSRVDPLVWSPVLIWPPVVTASLVELFSGLAGQAGLFAGRPSVWIEFETIPLLATAVLLPAILALYVRAISVRAPEATRWRGRHAILFLIALQQTVLCLALLWIWRAWPLQTQGADIVVVVVVATALWLEMRAGSTRRPDATRRGAPSGRFGARRR